MRRTAIVCVLVLAGAAGAQARTAARGQANLPAGVFHATISDADLRAGHVPRNLWNEDHGSYTLTLRPGRFVLSQKATNPLQVPLSSGTTTDLVAGVVDFKTTKPASQAGFVILARWTFDGKLLRFRVLSPKQADVRVTFDAHPWRKVG